jgi:hypothetical protein
MPVVEGVAEASIIDGRLLGSVELLSVNPFPVEVKRPMQRQPLSSLALSDDAHRIR